MAKRRSTQEVSGIDILAFIDRLYDVVVRATKLQVLNLYVKIMSYDEDLEAYIARDVEWFKNRYAISDEWRPAKWQGFTLLDSARCGVSQFDGS